MIKAGSWFSFTKWCDDMGHAKVLQPVVQVSPKHEFSAHAIQQQRFAFE
jgi:hypothetical protein